MSLRTIVRFLQFALPGPIFRRFRRAILLCKYNIHSASKQLCNYATSAFLLLKRASIEACMSIATAGDNGRRI